MNIIDLTYTEYCTSPFAVSYSTPPPPKKIKSMELGPPGFPKIKCFPSGSNLGRPCQGIFSFNWISHAMKYKVLFPLAQPIAALLILPALFWDQNYVPVRPYALTFLVFSFFYIVFRSFLFVILLSSLISSYSSVLILLFLSLLVLFFVFSSLLIFILLVVFQTCILMI